ncbi:MAG: type 4a pilus biogenesis protein PilO [Magnetococcales bacterium]|nr:type 4a pilus biogenesis protein PilO [Magnetococcales bacterium]
MELGIDPLVILRLPLLKKLGIAAGILLAVAAGYYQFYYKAQSEQLETLVKAIQEQELKIQSQKSLLKELPALRAELEDLHRREEEAMKVLPTEKEIPSLLTDVSSAGHAEGLDFLLFAPGAEIKRDFYAEVPISLNFTGGFHDTAIFLDRVAHLPRVVNLSNLSLRPDSKVGKLVVDARATTYRFLTQEEVAKARSAPKAGDKNKAAKAAKAAPAKPKDAKEK